MTALHHPSSLRDPKSPLPYWARDTYRPARMTIRQWEATCRVLWHIAEHGEPSPAPADLAWRIGQGVTVDHLADHAPLIADALAVYRRFVRAGREYFVFANLHLRRAA